MTILVVAEQSGGQVKKATLSAITFAREVAQREGIAFNIAVLGAGAAAAGQALSAYGASKVYTVENAALDNYLAMPYSAAISELAGRSEARWVVMTSTTMGKDVMPRVAVRLNAGLAADIVQLGGEGADLKLVRPMWAGNVLAQVNVLTEIKCVTVRGSDWDDATETGGQSEVLAATESADAAASAAGKMRFVSFAASGGDRPELTEADVVVAGGRGLKSEENFHILDELADELGAALGASRAAVDAGYAPNDYQVGQTGKSVAPNLYIAVAISGAIQHLAGMKNSKIIVAINKDEEAPIFQVSDYGLVADAFSAVPEIAASLRQAG